MTSSLAHVEDNVGEAFFAVQELCEKFHDFMHFKKVCDNPINTADALMKCFEQYARESRHDSIAIRSDVRVRISSLKTLSPLD